ncbi:hypothetical protein JB92DRAFT_2961429 [Gautieria morchelliformis]|nr:hypothetical protein JB92DRAFT_2961429 [Gautieria morchelliformis]
MNQVENKLLRMICTRRFGAGDSGQSLCNTGIDDALVVRQLNVKENMEMLNMPKFTPHYTQIPQTDFIKAFHDESGPFHRLVWDNIALGLLQILRLLNAPS